MTVDCMCVELSGFICRDKRYLNGTENGISKVGKWRRENGTEENDRWVMDETFWGRKQWASGLMRHPKRRHWEEDKNGGYRTRWARRYLAM